MGVTATRLPRAKILVRTNQCVNPSVETSMDGWSFLGDGSTNTGYRNGNYARAGSQGLYKQFGGQPTTWEDIGFQFYCANWGAGATRAVRIQAAISIDGVQTCIKAYFYNSSGAVIGSVQYGTIATSIAGVWGDVVGQFTAPAGTVGVRLNYVMLQQGRAPGTGTVFACDGLCIEADGVQRAPYFDGDTYAAGYQDLNTVWEGTAHASRSLMYQLDPRDVVAPQLVKDGYEVTQQSRNVVHQLIDGGVAASLFKGAGRRGTLRLFFLNAADAETARQQHATVGTFTYVDTDQPQENMTYVVDGAVRKYQTHHQLRWVVEVPYAELV